jgi:hypothetical protein
MQVMAAEDFSSDKERLQAAIGSYQAKKAEIFPEVEDVTPAEALSLTPETVLFVDARDEKGEFKVLQVAIQGLVSNFKVCILKV